MPLSLPLSIVYWRNLIARVGSYFSVERSIQIVPQFKLILIVLCAVKDDLYRHTHTHTSNQPETWQNFRTSLSQVVFKKGGDFCILNLFGSFFLFCYHTHPDNQLPQVPGSQATHGYNQWTLSPISQDPQLQSYCLKGAIYFLNMPKSNSFIQFTQKILITYYLSGPLLDVGSCLGQLRLP